ncbi:RNA 2'-phosphotransferase [Bremerella sp. JC817]|uniref:RNA 2'-phosphotransferase n=1 Tax=Bremerella sp. JC817 TaxID=3231756 RepID=UPI0034585067
MTSKEKLKKISKTMSYVLRHRPDMAGLTLAPGGWVAIADLLEAFQREGKSVSESLLLEVVQDNDKQRFEISDDGLLIRARQGHSAEVDLQYEAAEPPSILYHGTATRFLDSIRQQGLIKGKRHHVHMSVNQQTMLEVAQRHGKPVLLAIASGEMHAAGHQFFVTGNDVWLTDHVPPGFLKVLETTS